MIYQDIQILSARLHYTDCPCGLAALLHIMMFPPFVCTCRRSAMDRARATSDTDNNTLYPVIHYTTNVLRTRPPHAKAKGTYNHHNITISLIWCAYFSLLYSLTPGVSGQVALAAPVALIALVIYHLTFHTRDLPQYIYVTNLG